MYKRSLCFIIILILIISITVLCFADGGGVSDPGQDIPNPVPSNNIEYYSGMWERMRRQATEQFDDGEQLTDSLVRLETAKTIKFKVTSTLATRNVSYNVLYNLMMLHTKDYNLNMQTDLQ